MADIQDTSTDAQDHNGQARDDDFRAQDAHLETELERAEQRRRQEREHPIFGVHPDGLGPTLGQDLGKPNPGRDVDWNDETYDPPT